MNLSTRKLLDKSFSGLGLSSIALMGITLVLILAIPHYLERFKGLYF